MSQFKKASELHHAWANWLDMCEGTEVDVNSGWKCGGYSAAASPSFQGKFSDYEIAISIVENKPVFIGDVLYSLTNGGKYEAVNLYKYTSKDYSWNPPKPKPKTAMVELLMGDIEYWSGLHGEYTSPHSRRFYSACLKTLEKDGESIK